MELIDCRHCTELDCNGCNMYTLQKMLYNNKFNKIMMKNHSIDETANIKRLVVGKWQGVSPFVDSMECSICRYSIMDSEFRTPFCPWCGAYMKNWDESWGEDGTK